MTEQRERRLKRQIDAVRGTMTEYVTGQLARELYDIPGVEALHAAYAHDLIAPTLLALVSTPEAEGQVYEIERRVGHEYGIEIRTHVMGPKEIENFHANLKNGPWGPMIPHHSG